MNRRGGSRTSCLHGHGFDVGLIDSSSLYVTRRSQFQPFSVPERYARHERRIRNAQKLSFTVFS
jgi:hypothetical protein